MTSVAATSNSFLYKTTKYNAKLKKKTAISFLGNQVLLAEHEIYTLTHPEIRAVLALPFGYRDNGFGYTLMESLKPLRKTHNNILEYIANDMRYSHRLDFYQFVISFLTSDLGLSRTELLKTSNWGTDSYGQLKLQHYGFIEAIYSSAVSGNITAEQRRVL